MFELDDMKKYLLSVAMASYNYSEYLKIDDKVQTDTLGYILRMYQDKINKLQPQELALLITYLNDIKEEFYLEYINLFDDFILSDIIGKSKSIDEQFTYLKMIEDVYFLFAFDLDEPVNKEILRKII